MLLEENVCTIGLHAFAMAKSMRDEPRSGQPSTIKAPEDAVRLGAMLTKERRLPQRIIAEELVISKDTGGTVVFEELGKRKVCSRLVHNRLSKPRRFRLVVL